MKDNQKPSNEPQRPQRPSERIVWGFTRPPEILEFFQVGTSNDTVGTLNDTVGCRTSSSEFPRTECVAVAKNEDLEGGRTSFYNYLKSGFDN